MSRLGIEKHPADPRLFVHCISGGKGRPGGVKRLCRHFLFVFIFTTSLHTIMLSSRLAHQNIPSSFFLMVCFH